MRLAGQAGTKAMESAMRYSNQKSSSLGFVEERELIGQLDLACRQNGAHGLAYPPVVAGGDRANTIHYLNADQVSTCGDFTK